MVITSAVDPTLHATQTVFDVLEGTAEFVRCPDCGEFEVWSLSEIQDHGHCRADANRCPVCAEAEAHAAEAAAAADRAWEASIAEDDDPYADDDDNAETDPEHCYDGTEHVMRSVVVARGWQWKASYIEETRLWLTVLTPTQRHRLARVVRDLFETLALRAGVDAVWWIDDGEVVAIDPPEPLPDLEALKINALNAVRLAAERRDMHPDDINGIYDAAYESLGIE